MRNSLKFPEYLNRALHTFCILTITAMNVIVMNATAMNVTAAVIEYIQTSPSDRLYYTLPEVFKAFNDHVGPQGYAMIKTRIKESKKEVLRKCVFRCDRDEKANSDEIDKLFHASSRLIRLFIQCSCFITE